jgi:acetyl-CoA carboxylase carboxyltransferase component
VTGQADGERQQTPPSAGRPASAGEQKLDQYRKRRHDVLHRDSRGQPDARARIEALLDRGSFVELDMFATARATDTDMSMDERRAPGEGVVVGFGSIDGRDVAVHASDPTFLGGSLGEVTAEKIVKVQELALRNHIPIVGISDSSGARIQEGVAALAGYADIVYRSVRSSGVVPQLGVVAGPSTGAAAYSPALSDFVFVVANAGSMLMAAGEVGLDEPSGADVLGARSGVAHFLPGDEAECWAGVRRLLSYLPSSSAEAPPVRATRDDPARADPELQTIVPDDPGLPYDMREVATRLLDERQLLEVQPFFAPNMLIGFGRLDGCTVGVVGNQPQVLAGAIDIDASTKAARFIRFCDAFNIPILSLVDVPGYLPGTAQEHGGIIRHGAKLLYAYAEATVPKLAVVTRRDYGGAYCVMSPKQMGADLNLAWPSAEIAVMGPEAAVNVIHRRELAEAPDPAARRAELVADYTARFANPYAAAERGYVDGVVEPRETRRELIRALRLCLHKKVDRPPRKHGNIPL